jgi:hypothetical protein
VVGIIMEVCRYWCKPVPRPKIKQLPKRLRQIVADIADGLTVEQACAGAGISPDTYWAATKPGSRYACLRAKAEAGRIKYFLKQMRRAGKNDWRCWAWELEKVYRRQYGEDKNVMVYAEQNNYTISEEKAREIDARVERIRKELENGNGNSALEAGDHNGNGKGAK